MLLDSDQSFCKIADRNLWMSFFFRFCQARVRYNAWREILRRKPIRAAKDLAPVFRWPPIQRSKRFYKHGKPTEHSDWNYCWYILYIFILYIMPFHWCTCTLYLYKYHCFEDREQLESWIRHLDLLFRTHLNAKSLAGYIRRRTA